MEKYADKKPEELNRNSIRSDINSNYPPQSSLPFDFSFWQKLALWFAGWTFLGMLQAVRLYQIYNYSAHARYGWGQVIAWSLAEWYLWGLLSLIIIRIVRKMPFERKRWLRFFSIHFLCAIAISVAHIFLYMIAFELLKYGSFLEAFSHLNPSFASVVDAVNLKFFHSLLTYFLIAFFSFAVIFYGRFMNEKNLLAQAESQLALSRLNALKSQLHPHFLFNTLNAISELVHSNPQKADVMIARLSELLRIPLENESIQEVTLKSEIEFLDRYIEIQKMRFGEKLKIKWSISPDTIDSQVPFLILQPIVENAIQHGISKSSNGGILHISGRVEDDTLILEVSDSGPGLEDEWQSHSANGRGLSNTQERLKRLYGSNHKFNLKNKEDGGLSVIIEIPYKSRPYANSDNEF